MGLRINWSSSADPQKILESFSKQDPLYAWTMQADEIQSYSPQQKVEHVIFKVLGTAQTYKDKTTWTDGEQLVLNAKAFDAATLPVQTLAHIQNTVNMLIFADKCSNPAIKEAAKGGKGFRTVNFSTEAQIDSVHLSSQSDLTDLSDSLVFAHVKKLFFKNVPLFRISSNILQHSEIEELDLENTRLKDLAVNLKGSLGNLKMLNLSNNPDLKEFPKNFWKNWSQPITIIISRNMTLVLKDHKQTPANLNLTYSDGSAVGLIPSAKEPSPLRTRQGSNPTPDVDKLLAELEEAIPKGGSTGTQPEKEPSKVDKEPITSKKEESSQPPAPPSGWQTVTKYLLWVTGITAVVTLATMGWALFQRQRQA